MELFHIVEETGSKTSIGWEKLRETVHKVTRFLDNVIEVNNFPPFATAQKGTGIRARHRRGDF